MLDISVKDSAHFYITYSETIPEWADPTYTCFHLKELIEGDGIHTIVYVTDIVEIYENLEEFCLDGLCRYNF